jgi:hypothetical protein
MKGLFLPNDTQARAIIDSRGGIQCNWWRDVHVITPQQIRDKLTAANLDMHVNHFSENAPGTTRPFSEQTPFISMSSGTVERDAAARSNYVHSALRTALWFGTEFLTRDVAYVFTCWVVVGLRPAVEIEGVAEEIRELNVYRRYSAYQTEGEVTAKIFVPDNHITECRKWRVDRRHRSLCAEWVQKNPRFTEPETLSNIREVI